MRGFVLTQGIRGTAARLRPNCCVGQIAGLAKNRLVSMTCRDAVCCLVLFGVVQQRAPQPVAGSRPYPPAYPEGMALGNLSILRLHSQQLLTLVLQRALCMLLAVCMAAQ